MAWTMTAHESVSSGTSTNATGTARAATSRAAVDFAHPLRDYSCQRVSGWPILMEEEMQKKDPELCKKAMARVEAKLKEIHAMLPPHAARRLQHVPIFLMYGEASSNGGKSEGAQYFAQTAPNFSSKIDPRMGGSVVIYSAKHFCEMTDFGALKLLLHELSHAWHLEQWPENRSDIVSTYKNAMEKGLYRNVRRSDGSVAEETYASVNHLEYFAELSCIWFCGNDHFPFDRGDLRLYDKAGFDMIKKLWSEGGPQEVRVVQR